MTHDLNLRLIFIKYIKSLGFVFNNKANAWFMGSNILYIYFFEYKLNGVKLNQVDLEPLKRLERMKKLNKILSK